MKKLLSLLSAVALTATAASTLVSCSSDIYQSGVINKYYQFPKPEYNADRIKASLVVRSKTLIAEDLFHLSDAEVKPYVLDKFTVNTAIVGKTVRDKEVGREKISDDYESFFKDDGIKELIDTEGKNTLGDNGGLIAEIKDQLINYVANAISGGNTDTANIIKSAINTILNALNLGSNDFKTVADQISTYINAGKPLTAKVVLEVLPSALGMIPDLSKNKNLFNGLQKLLGQLTGSAADNIVNLFGSLNDYSNVNDLIDGKKVSDAPTIIKTLLANIADPNLSKDKYLPNILKFVSVLGYYISFLDFNSGSDDVLGQLAANGSKLLNTSVFYGTTSYQETGSDGKPVTKTGTTFNLIPALNDAAHYFGNGTDQEKILKVAQMMFLTIDGGSIKLNDLGKMLFENGNDGISSSFLNLINSWLGTDNKITAEQGEDIFLGILANTVTDKSDKYSVAYKDADFATKNLATMFKPNDEYKTPADFVYQDWTQIGELNGVKLGDAIAKDNTLQAAFNDDNSAAGVNFTTGYSLNTLLNTAPLYKMIFINSQKVKEVPGFGSDDLIKNGGLLPNFLGYYTQLPIQKLADELSSTFKLSSIAKDNDQIKKNYFDFSKLQTLISYIVKNDPENGESIISSLLKTIGDDNVISEVGQKLGYVKAEDNSKFINGNIVTANSFVGQLIQTFMPGLKPRNYNGQLCFIDTNDKNDPEDTKWENFSDTLSIFMNALSAVVTKSLTGTNYNYWMNRVLNSTQNDNLDDIDKSVWYYKDEKAPDWDFGNYGFSDTTTFRSGLVKNISLVIRFDLSNVPSIINRLPISKTQDNSGIFKITASRKEASDQLAITGFEKLGL